MEAAASSKVQCFRLAAAAATAVGYITSRIGIPSEGSTRLCTGDPDGKPANRMAAAAQLAGRRFGLFMVPARLPAFDSSCCQIAGLFDATTSWSPPRLRWFAIARDVRRDHLATARPRWQTRPLAARLMPAAGRARHRRFGRRPLAMPAVPAPSHARRGPRPGIRAWCRHAR